ncbi:MAG: glycosyltransferase family 4 protein [Clostridia bacterium]|nr:glycosyltransferase family 4 protein [Clostridia bacterium]
MINPIAIFVPNLLTWNGKKPIIGGLEKYVLALAELLTSMNYFVSFHQNAYKDFKTTYLNWPIYGYKADPHHLQATTTRMEKSITGRVLYSSIAQQVYYRPGSICISHGVWWELPSSTPSSARKFYETLVASALNQANLIVSCDYNFLNVSRAIYPNLADKKIRVIPNFVDSQQFSPRKKDHIKHLRILYPRRISPERGFSILINVITPLLAEYDNIEFQFAIDTNFPENLKHFQAWHENEVNKERILLCHPDFQSMPKVYDAADIVVIPSLYSEGTSFSCLEAMAMGKAIIATNVGGLTNLIIDGYNGLLIHPSQESLFQALRFLINNHPTRSYLGANALATSQAFGRDIWEARWSECIKKFYPNS